MTKANKTKCPKCGHDWNYKGKSEYYMTCPNCYRKIKAQRKKITSHNNGGTNLNGQPNTATTNGTG